MKSTSPSGEEEAEERSAGFLVFRRSDGQRLYLLVRHRDGGHWAFPKGRIEPGEEEIVAARREIAEETGIRRLRPVPGFRATTAYRFAREQCPVAKTVVYFLGEAEADRVQLSSEHSDAAWLEPAAAMQRLTHVENRRLVDEAETCLARASRGTPGERTGRGDGGKREGVC